MTVYNFCHLQKGSKRSREETGSTSSTTSSPPAQVMRLDEMQAELDQGSEKESREESLMGVETDEVSCVF